MNVGKKIKKIRQFRGLKQAELGQLLGMGDTSQARIGQYEIGFRTPSKELLDRMAKVLDVNPQTLYDNTGENASELMELFFWLEEDHPGLLHIFEMKRWPGERINTTQDINIYYHDNEYWPARRPHGLWLNYGTILDSFMAEWAYRQHERRIGLITDEEYFEWKINWPETCDDCGRALPHKEWRKQPEDKEKQLAVLRKLLPKDNRDIDALPDLQRLTDEQFAPLIPDLLECYKDYDKKQPVAQYICDLLAERKALVLPVVEKIMAGEDEDWKLLIRMELLPKLEKTNMNHNQ